MVTLVELPTELIEQILQQLSPSDLPAALVACRRMKDIGEKVLYASVVIRSFSGLQSFGQSLSNNPDLGAVVRSYIFDVPAEEVKRYIGNGNEVYWHDHVSIIKRLSKLEHLKIYSPWWTVVELDLALDRSRLPDLSKQSHISTHLKSVHINYLNDDFDWFCSGSDLGSIFLLPHLESLTLTSLELCKIQNVTPHNSSKALKTLRLIDCDVNPDSVTSIINTAHALERLEIWTREFPDHCEHEDLREHHPPLMQDWIDCLKPVRHTLRKLVVGTLYARNGESPPPLFFKDHTALKQLVIQAHRMLGKNYDSRLLPDIFPPSLETLKLLCNGNPRPSYVTNGMIGPGLAAHIMIGILEDATYLRNLRKIVLKTITHGYGVIPKELAKCAVPEFEKLLAACNARGIELLEETDYDRGWHEDNFYGEGEFSEED